MDRLEPIWSTLRPSLFLEGGHKEDLLEWLYKNAQKMSEHHLTEHIYWKSVIDLCMDMKGRCDQKSDETTLLSIPERSAALSITSSVPSASVSPNVNSGFFPSPSSGTTSPFPSQRENRSASAYVPMTQVNAEQQTLENSNSETTTTTTYTPIQPTTTTNSISPRTSVVVDSPSSSLPSPPKPSETQETSSYATPIEEPKNENLPTSSSEITPKSAPPSRAETPVKENDIFLQESTRPTLTRPTSASVTWPPPPPATPAGGPASMQTPVKKWPPPPPSTSSSSTSSSTSTQTIRPPPPHPSLKSPIKPVPTETPTKQLPPPTTTPTTTSATPTRVLPPPRRKFEVPKKIETSSSVASSSSSSEKTEEIETVVSPGETTPLKPELVKQPSDVKSEETTSSTTTSSSSTSAPIVSESPARRPPPPVRTIGGRPAIGRVAFINKSLTFGVGSPPSLGAVVMTGLGSKPAPPRIVSTNPSSTTIISPNPSGTKTPPPEEADKSSEKKKIYAKALYDNPGENMAESALPFKAGDIVEVLSQDGEWWWGSLKGKMGYVPSNFFTIVDSSSSLTPPPPSTINTSASPTKTSTIPKPGQLVATTLYDYTPDPPSESSLPIKKGDVVIIDTNILPLDASSEWLYAILDQKGGYIPRNYVQIKT